jgi:osmotically-inducible protein OsmY
MGKRIGIIALMGVLCTSPFLAATAQEGVGERIGEKLDRGLSQLRSELRDEWSQLKRSVERMGVHGRVYSRLRWDKAIEGTAIDIEVREESVVVLRGEVRSAAAKEKAVQLAQDTVGVNEVVDQLTVSAATQ